MPSHLGKIAPCERTLIAIESDIAWSEKTPVRVPPIPGHGYVEDIVLAAMLAAKRLEGVAPEVNIMECVTYTPLPSVNKAAHSGFETQRRCHHQSKIGALKKEL